MPVHSQPQFTAAAVKHQQIKLGTKMRENLSLPLAGTQAAPLGAGARLHVCWGGEGRGSVSAFCSSSSVTGETSGARLIVPIL